MERKFPQCVPTNLETSFLLDIDDLFRKSRLRCGCQFPLYALGLTLSLICIHTLTHTHTHTHTHTRYWVNTFSAPLSSNRCICSFYNFGFQPSCQNIVVSSLASIFTGRIFGVCYYTAGRIPRKLAIATQQRFPRKWPISSRQLIFRLACAHWGNLHSISCSHHLKYVCLPANFVHSSSAMSDNNIVTCWVYVTRQITLRLLGCSEFIEHSLSHLHNFPTPAIGSITNTSPVVTAMHSIQLDSATARLKLTGHSLLTTHSLLNSVGCSLLRLGTDNT
jgi:hypothetical protein